MNATRRRALLSLILLVPAPTIGILSGQVWFPGSATGMTIFFLMKVWLLALPVFWHRVIDRAPLSFSPARKGGFAFGAVSGLAIGALIVGIYLVFGSRVIDIDSFGRTLHRMGLDHRGRYIAGAIYWVAVNAVLEEYVWRWFVVQQSERLVGPRVAIALSAGAFTIHHVFAVFPYLGAWLSAVAGAGIMVGGCLWSWTYLRYESIWPGYLSHSIVDVAIFGVGYAIAFG